MAAYHFTAKIHSRGKGASAVRAAAYRAAERLNDERLGKIEDYSRKSDVVETTILTPASAPDWMRDRAKLWNRVEAHEKRKDAQVAQEIEINLPRELSDEDNWHLVLEFAAQHLVKAGRVCDIAMHVHEVADGSLHPHAHILMPVREITADGFGAKHPDCDWRKFLDRRDRLGELRTLWGDFARDYAAQLGIDLGPDWDHRSYKDRGVDLEGQPKVGATAQRLEVEGTATERTDEYLAAQRRNGDLLLARPETVLDALTGRQSTFTEAEIARFVHRHSADDQLQAIMAAVRSRCVSVGQDRYGRERFSSAEMIQLEKTMVEDAGTLAATGRHKLDSHKIEKRLTGAALSDEQRAAARELLSAGDLACLIGYAGAGKSRMLDSVRDCLEAGGYNVRGAALSGIAAANLKSESGIEARTIASLRYAWDKDRDTLTDKDVLVVDEAGMIGSRELSQVIAEARSAGAKVILVGDPEQLQAIEAGAAFRAIADRTGAAELTEIRRQQVEWQRDATKQLATGRTAEALASYREAGDIRAYDTDAEAKAALVAGWQQARLERPDHSRIMLAHTRADVRDLNAEARAILRDAGGLGEDVKLTTTRGEREFATGDRLLFLRNERQLDVRNGTLGTIMGASADRLTIRADDGRMIEVDPRLYNDIEHGYAVTVHKSQGVTVDSAHVLATRGFDRHLAYVAASRHRHELKITLSREAFEDDATLAKVLGRERAKDTSLDYQMRDIMPDDLKIPAPRPTDEFFEQHGQPKPTRPGSMEDWLEQAKENERRGLEQSRDQGLER